ncbi:uncharacterized protein LOC112543056 [Python bivittatus]|uniref:Uncharacterized protein LOC112543056 n=1 Tax=Python bivittatus TaxID=176946 RepID=A0A9F5N7F8_PYTBI|nr:uncharacterized protein LOC112543056 [Python bivittatus]
MAKGKTVVDASGKMEKVALMESVPIEVNGKRLEHQFLYMDKCPASLLGDSCKLVTVSLLNFLGCEGFKVSKSKAQIALTVIVYLGFVLSRGQRQLSQERKETVCRVGLPETKRQWRTFLGMTGFCRLWIPNYSIIAKPLYEALKGPGEWVEATPEMKQAFKVLKEKLLSAPALGLLDPEKPHELFVLERDGMALGVLTRRIGSWRRPVASLSKQLGQAGKGWPTCLRAGAATILLSKEAGKFTLGAPITVHVPHAVTTVLEQKGGLWISNARLGQYQAALLDSPELRFITSTCLNPATLLPKPQPDGDPILHDYQEFSSRQDLRDVPISHADCEFFVDGSSIVRDGLWRAGYAVVTEWEVVEAKPLPPGTSAQQAELIGLTRAFQLGKGKKTNIFTDSRYAFGVLHAFGGMWKNRGFRTVEGEEIKNLKEVQALFEAVHLPLKAAGMQVKGRGKALQQTERNGN